MPAYFRPFERPDCERPRCTRRADGQVFNTYNAPVGWYCLRHGHDVIVELNTDAAGEHLKR